MEYKPIKLIDSKDLGYMTYKQAEKYEYKAVRAYMRKVGLNNARGGDLTYDGEYAYFFNYILPKEDKKGIIYTLYLGAIIIATAVFYYIKK